MLNRLGRKLFNWFDPSTLQVMTVLVLTEHVLPQFRSQWNKVCYITYMNYRLYISEWPIYLLLHLHTLQSLIVTMNRQSQKYFWDVSPPLCQSHRLLHPPGHVSLSCMWSLLTRYTASVSLRWPSFRGDRYSTYSSQRYAVHVFLQTTVLLRGAGAGAAHDLWPAALLSVPPQVTKTAAAPLRMCASCVLRTVRKVRRDSFVMDLV